MKAGAKPVMGVDLKPDTEWLKPGLIDRVRHLNGEETLRHARACRRLGNDSQQAASRANCRRFGSTRPTS